MYEYMCLYCISKKKRNSLVCCTTILIEINEVFWRATFASEMAHGSTSVAFLVGLFLLPALEVELDQVLCCATLVSHMALASATVAKLARVFAILACRLIDHPGFSFDIATVSAVVWQQEAPCGCSSILCLKHETIVSRWAVAMISHLRNVMMPEHMVVGVPARIRIVACHGGRALLNAGVVCSVDAHVHIGLCTGDASLPTPADSSFGAKDTERLGESC
jgi:hypothetical protein